MHHVGTAGHDLFCFEKLQIQFRSQFRQTQLQARIPMSLPNGIHQERVG